MPDESAKSGRTHPRGLMKKDKDFSFSNAVLQALATALNPTWLVKELGDDYIGPRFPIEHSWSASKMDRTIQKAITTKEGQRSLNPVAELLYVLECMQVEEDGSFECVNPYPLQIMLSLGSCEAGGSVPENPFEWLCKILDLISCHYPRDVTPITEESRHVLVNSLFRISMEYATTCMGSMCKGHATDRGQRSSWTLPIDVPFKDPSSSSPMSITSCLKRYYEKIESKEARACEKCGDRMSNQERWTGFTQLPDTLIVEFRYAEPRRSARKAGGSSNTAEQGVNVDVTLDGVLHLREFSKSSIESVVYGLQTIVKSREKGGKGGHYQAFTKTNDGQWWKCDEQVVTKSTLVNAYSSAALDGGRAHLAFYARVLPQ
ncbi:cysteine proteinase [Trematosphaeria pertusa]|uniref:Cysteine proteinase n=1 Tax=Trematosphaeria pertusa TaxID=390896 RepID=A0A6A6IX72_9PLEO|nr:cysteine proteinase [Trematosphaeria pertusa]KAF2255131.1 cysteine proteinase [Trematosphaeria pertusa]